MHRDPRDGEHDAELSIISEAVVKPIIDICDVVLHTKPEIIGRMKDYHEYMTTKTEILSNVPEGVNVDKNTKLDELFESILNVLLKRQALASYMFNKKHEEKDDTN